MLVGAIALQPGETQRQSARITRALLDVAKGDFDDEFGTDVDRPRVASGVQAPRRRRFAVRSHSTGFSIDDRLIVDASRTSACRVLQALFQRFADDLSAGGDVRPISVEELADIVQENEDDVRDAESVRRTIDRVRDQITAVIRRETGRPIGDNDIIETVSRTGALKGSRGYRLNSRTVMLAAATP